MKIGEIVTFTTELYDRTGVPGLVDYPALVYKIVNWNTANEVYELGLYVFTDEGMKQFRNVPHSVEQKANSWRSN